MKPYKQPTRLGLLRRLRRAQALGCTRAFANAYDPPADALYGSMLGTLEVSETLSRELPA